MFVRWLLPVVAALAVLAGSVTAFAAAGVIAESACCCPDPDTCKCHDHDKDSHPEPELKRCAGTAKLVAPHLSGVTLPEAIVETVPRTITIVAHVNLPEPEPRYASIETPPF